MIERGFQSSAAKLAMSELPEMLRGRQSYLIPLLFFNPNEGNFASVEL